METISGMRNGRRNKILRDVVFIFLSLLLVSFSVFFLSSFSSGNISYYVLGENADSDDVNSLSSNLGLDRPFLVRYFDFLKDFFTLNWGENIQGYDIKTLIAQRFLVTFEVMLLTLVLSIPSSILISCLAVRKEGRFFDKLSDFFSLSFLSLPSFSIAILLMLLFSFLLPIFPSSGFIPLSKSFLGNLSTLFLPSLSLSLMHSALYVRVLKKSLKREMHSDYILGARARGERDGDIILKEALAPSLLPLVALLSQSISSLIAGSAVTETVFALPGLGSLIVSSALSRDSATVSILIMIIAIVVSMTSLLSRLIISLMVHTEEHDE